MTSKPISEFLFHTTFTPQLPEIRTRNGKLPIHALVHPYNIEPKASQFLWSSEKQERLVTLWSNGVQWLEIAEELQETTNRCQTVWHNHIKPKLPEYQVFLENKAQFGKTFNRHIYQEIHETLLLTSLDNS